MPRSIDTVKYAKGHIVPKVIKSIVDNDLCTGCGVCTYVCPDDALGMARSEDGFLVPQLVAKCGGDGKCLEVCPFNISPRGEIKDEDGLASLFLADAEKHHPKIGSYTGIYAGHSLTYRLSSSSGGVGTYVVNRLLSGNIVDHVLAVEQGDGPEGFYHYAVISDESDVLKGSKTRYYPVTLADVLSKLDELGGRVGIVGVACFVKAVRLAQYNDPLLKEKISFLIGIICGGLKSSFFTEYLGERAGVSRQSINKPSYREKDIRSTASDYSFTCENVNSKKVHTIKMVDVGDMWGTGLFKANACDFCDDVSTELADISIGDAWLEPFVNDGHGANVIVTRSALAEEIIQRGLADRELQLEQISLQKFLSSQSGSFNHRHTGLLFRANVREKIGRQPVPPRRNRPERSTVLFRLVQILRMRTRRRSLEVWRTSQSAWDFDRRMRIELRLLSFVTRLNHRVNALGKKFNRHMFGRN